MTCVTVQGVVAMQGFATLAASRRPCRRLSLAESLSTGVDTGLLGSMSQLFQPAPSVGFRYEGTAGADTGHPANGTPGVRRSSLAAFAGRAAVPPVGSA